MVALDIEFEEEEKESSAAPKQQEPMVDDVSLEFSASTELINLAGLKNEDKSKSHEIKLTADSEKSDPQIIADENVLSASESSAPKTEISEEMKAVVNKVKAESAKIRSIDDARQKKPSAPTAPSSVTQAKATPVAKPAITKPVAAATHQSLGNAAVAMQVEILGEAKNLALLEKLEKIDSHLKIEVDAELRVAKAEARGEAMAFYLSEAKLLEYQIVALLKRLPVKTQEELKVLQQIQKRLSDNTKKKPSF